MDLKEIDVPVCWDTPPPKILRTIEIAERLHQQMKSDETQKRFPMLVNSNYYIAYHALKHVRDTGLGGDLSFCEWGSGLGVVTCIASQLGFHATGIEIEESLCIFARTLAKAANVNAEFIQASYREQGLPSDEVTLKHPMTIRQRAFAVFYAYPWPAEEGYLESLFTDTNAASAVLVTYHGGTTVRARQKALRKRRTDR